MISLVEKEILIGIMKRYPELKRVQSVSGGIKYGDGKLLKDELIHKVLGELRS